MHQNNYLESSSLHYHSLLSRSVIKKVSNSLKLLTFCIQSITVGEHQAIILLSTSHIWVSRCVILTVYSCQMVHVINFILHTAIACYSKIQTLMGITVCLPGSKPIHSTIPYIVKCRNCVQCPGFTSADYPLWDNFHIGNSIRDSHATWAFGM